MLVPLSRIHRTAATLSADLDDPSSDAYTLLKGSCSEERFSLVRRRYSTLLEEYRNRFGGDDRIVIASSSGRLILAGEQLDYQYGRVLNTAIDKDLIVIVSPRDDTKIGIQSLDFEKQPEILASISDFIPRAKKRSDLNWWETSYSLIRVLSDHLKARYGRELPGLSILIDSRKEYGGIPIGIGLSSSGALEVSLANAICDFVGIRGEITVAEITYVAKKSEEAVGFYPGIQDPWACLNSTPDIASEDSYANLIDCQPFTNELGKPEVHSRLVRMPPQYAATIVRVLDREDTAHLRWTHNHWVAESEIATVSLAGKIRSLVESGNYKVSGEVREKIIRYCMNPPEWKPGYFRADALLNVGLPISQADLMRLIMELPDNVHLSDIELDQPAKHAVRKIVAVFDRTDDVLKDRSFSLSSILLHFFEEDVRTIRSAEALETGDIRGFAALQQEIHASLIARCRMHNAFAERVIERLQKDSDAMLACRILGPGAGSNILIWSERDKREKLIADVTSCLKAELGGSFDTDMIMPVDPGCSARVVFPFVNQSEEV